MPRVNSKKAREKLNKMHLNNIRRAVNEAEQKAFLDSAEEIKTSKEMGWKQSRKEGRQEIRKNVIKEGLCENHFKYYRTASLRNKRIKQ